MTARCLIAAAGFGFAAACLVSAGSKPAAAAYAWYPYCGVYQDRSGAWSCRFASLEECTFTMRAGNSGFCRENPAPRPVAPTRRRAKRR